MITIIFIIIDMGRVEKIILLLLYLSSATSFDIDIG